MVKMSHFNFNVINLEKSLKFYRDSLGLEPVNEMEASDGSFKIVFLGDGKSEFSLELTWLRDRTEPYDLGEGEIHLGLVADNFEELHKKHTDMDIICFENKMMGIYFIEDPDGYWLEIIPNR